MTISEEALMAYADGEADEATRARVESAMQEETEIAQRVARHRATRQVLQGAFSAVLLEPVPDRLIAAARGRAKNVADITVARAALNRNATGVATRRWQAFAIAASLLLGIAVGYFTWHGSNTVVEANGSGLFAGTALAEALSTQLSEDRGVGSAAVTSLSFRDKAGGYCRTFTLSGVSAASGLACREEARWKIKALAQGASDAAGANFRTAASALSPAIRAAVEEAIDGEPLDRAAEIAARQGGWASPAR